MQLLPAPARSIKALELFGTLMAAYRVFNQAVDLGAIQCCIVVESVLGSRIFMYHW